MAPDNRLFFFFSFQGSVPGLYGAGLKVLPKVTEAVVWFIFLPNSLSVHYIN
jgi:hypothetical protein